MSTVPLTLDLHDDEIVLIFEDWKHGNDVVIVFRDGETYQRTWTDAESYIDMEEILTPVNLLEKLAEIVNYVRDRPATPIIDKE